MAGKFSFINTVTGGGKKKPAKGKGSLKLSKKKIAKFKKSFNKKES